MTELTPYQQPSGYAPTDPTGGRLVAWAEGLAAAHRIGTALCQTSFVPKDFRGKPEEAAAAILYGDEIGFTPTQALQNIFVISGKPSMYARAMVALLLSHGHEVWTVEKTDAKVVVSGRRKGSTHVNTEMWTTARAAKAGYTSNKKYQTDPQAMLYARAASDVCRQVAPDSLAGIAYSIEELELDAPVPVVRVSRTKPTPPPAPEPDLQIEAAPQDAPEPEETPEPDVEPQKMTARTRGQLFALFSEQGWDDDTQRAWLTEGLGRTVESRASLTEDEALQAITVLRAPTQPEATP